MSIVNLNNFNMFQHWLLLLGDIGITHDIKNYVFIDQKSK